MTGSDDAFCKLLMVRSGTYPLVAFLAIAILLEYLVHYQFHISVAYTHLFYPIIVISAIWFQRRAVLIALFFGICHILVSYSIEGGIPAEAIFRAMMLCLVAYIAGSLVRCMTLFRNEVVMRNEELERTQAAYQMANKKLNLLSGITRHDILNQLTALLGYQEIAQEMCEDPALLDILQKEQLAAQTITRQMQFTRHYQDIGVKAPVWHNLTRTIQKIRAEFYHDIIKLTTSIPDVSIFADPLFPLICQNLIDNSVRHGTTLTRITFSAEPAGPDLLLVYEDDGIGVPEDEKTKIFERGYGKNTGMGLFLSQEILAITGLVMKETGIPGKGVRFEIRIPAGSFRYAASERDPGA